MSAFDDDIPAGYRDADIEQAALEDMARETLALRRAGRCTHTWTGPDASRAPAFTCYHCGFLWADRAHCDTHWQACDLLNCSCLTVQS